MLTSSLSAAKRIRRSPKASSREPPPLTSITPPNLVDIVPVGAFPAHNYLKPFHHVSNTGIADATDSSYDDAFVSSYDDATDPTVAEANAGRAQDYDPIQGFG